MTWWLWVLLLGLLVLFLSRTFGRISRLGGPLDPRTIRLRRRNIRTVDAEKRERRLIPYQFENDPPPTWVCYGCLWRGEFGEYSFLVNEDSIPYCPDCGGNLDAWDAYSPDPHDGAANG